MKRVFCFSLIFLLAIGINSTGFAASEKTVVWKYADYRPATGAGHKLISGFFKELETRSDGRFKIQSHWGGELGGAKELLPTVGSGVVDIAFTISLFYPGALPLSYVTWLPFVSNSRVDTTSVAASELFETNKAIQKELDSHNVVGGGIWAEDVYDLVSMDPIRKAEDFKGKKVRCGTYHGEVLKKFGASRVSIPGPEIYGAMQTGLIDVHLHYVDCFHKYGTWELVKYFTRGIGMGAATAMFGINKDSWNALPDDLKDIYRSVQKDLSLMSRSAFRDPERYGKQLELFKAKGIQFIEFPVAERNKLKEAAKSVWQEWAKSSGKPEVANEVLLRYNELLNKYKKKYPNGLPDSPKYPHVDIGSL
jgi:TRAP-type C4-dicarboxylate transport system substrate-binding protein